MQCRKIKISHAIYSLYGKFFFDSGYFLGNNDGGEHIILFNLLFSILPRKY